MKNETCHNCGADIAEKSIALAVAEAGLPQDEMLFFCPSYNSFTDMCQGYCAGDESRPAMWRTE